MIRKNNIKRYSLSPAEGQVLLNFNGRLSAEELYMQVYDVDEEKSELVNCKENEEKDGYVFDADCLSVCAFLKDNDKKVDLVYIDPPFASNANYSKKINLRIPKSKYEDTNMRETENSIGEEIMYGDIWNKEDYLNWLYTRLIAIREIMSENASIYVHLDYNIGHYVKVMMDEIFGEENFINEIIWQFFQGAKGEKEFAKKHHNIYLYAKNKNEYIFNKFKIKRYYDFKPSLTNSGKKKEDENEEEIGKDDIGYYGIVACPDVWPIRGVTNFSKEHTDYATQKPKALLERIIKASSNEGMIVADFFGGSGVTAKVAHDLNRKFITCDIGKNAIEEIRDGLKADGAKFEIVDIKDGLDLYRNPTQTMKKIFKLCSGQQRTNESEYSNLWDGQMPYNKKMLYVKIIDNRKILDENYLDYIITQISRDNIENQQNEYLLLYVYKDEIIDQKFVDKKVKETALEYKLYIASIEELLQERQGQINLPDSANITIRKKNDKFEVKILNYFSPYLRRKVEEENNKRVSKKGKNIIKLSDNGYEFIEMISIDTNLGKKWISSIEEKIENKNQTKGIFLLDTDKFRMKIRNIAGDEIIINSEDCKNEL